MKGLSKKEIEIVSWLELKGKKLDSIEGIREGDIKTSSKLKLDIRLKDVRVSGSDPNKPRTEADILVGPPGKVPLE